MARRVAALALAEAPKIKMKKIKDYPSCTVTGVAPGRQPDLINRYDSGRVPIEPPWGLEWIS